MIEQSKVSLNEEKITTLIKHIFKDQFRKQEQNNNRSLTMTMQEIKNLKMKLFQLLESIQFTQSEQEEKIEWVEKKTLKTCSKNEGNI